MLALRTSRLIRILLPSDAQAGKVGGGTVSGVPLYRFSARSDRLGASAIR